MAPNNDQNDNASTKTDQKPESDQSHGGEGNNDEEQQGGPPAAVGFWDPRLKHVRKEAFFKWTLTTGFLMVFIMAALSIYWAAQFYVERNMHSLRVYVVDFDGQTEPFNTSGVQPLVGPAITNLVQQMIESPMPRLGWTVPSPSEFNFDPIQVRQAVYDFKAWAAIVISPNATAMLRSAVTNGNASYDPMGACQIIYNQARQETTWANYLAPQLSALETQATSMIGMKWTQMVMQNATTDQSLLQNVARVPQALSPAIGFSRFNLRPFYPYQAVPSVSIGLIYLIILSFFSFAFYLPIHFKYLKPEGHPPLKFWQLIIWRWLSTISAYFMLSLAYSLVSLAFQINFSGTDYPLSPTEPSMSGPGYSNPDAYGHGTFPVYWMINFFGMIALGLACENVAMIVGQPWTGLWLIFWVITNVSTSFYIIDVEPGFYRWGYAWPLHYVVEGSRQVLFDLHSRIGMDFGILIAWGAVNTLVFPFACYFMRWKSQHHVHEYYK